ncbi:MAG TPA: amidase [Blastocatellia bacterium]|nr:amidase [Blastocatellia bacterium]
MLSDDIVYLSVRELGDQIKSGKLSPTELTQSYLERSQSIGKRLNAYATITYETALKQAHAAEAEIKSGKYRGPLHGIPYAAKDLLAVKGYPTTWGARPYANQMFDYDATVITKLQGAGAILVGKAAMIELAGGMGYRYATASATGAAKNPWNQDCWTCGSSSGSGAIAAAALAAFAIGTETWGSIICPSAYCGVSGLRPTYGRVSRHGAMALSYSMDKIGVLGRTADDCGLVLSVIGGHDPLDRSSLPEPSFNYTNPATKNGLRIGWLTNAWADVPATISAPVKAAVEVLKANGAIVEDAKLPDGPWEAAAGIIVSVEGATAFESLIESGKVAQLNDPLGKIGGYINQQIPASDYMRAIRIRGILQKKMDDLFEHFDVLAAASLPVTATTLDTNLETDLSFSDPLGGIGNFCGLPALSVMCGLSADKKLPVGIQFVGRPKDEESVIAAANLFQQHTDWHRKRPPLGKEVLNRK